MYAGIVAILRLRNPFGPLFQPFTREVTEIHFIHHLVLSILFGVVGGTEVEMSPLQFE